MKDLRTLFIIVYSFTFLFASGKGDRDECVSEYLTPTRIVWQSDNTQEWIKRSESLLLPGNGQSILSDRPLCVLKNKEGKKSAILLDFGKEISGGIQLVTGLSNPRQIKIRLRFGESASEAMSELGENGATTDHAMRDMIIELPWLGTSNVGNTGFRFVRIDLLNEEASLHLKELRAISRYRDIPYLGRFSCNNDRLNKIWQTGAYTVHLNMQEFLWDGIKRDRLVWLGDMHPEVMTINSVFGHNEVVNKSLDLMRDETPLPQWMNGFSSYSLWWIIIQRDWYLYNGDVQYLTKQKEYMVGLIKQILNKVDDEGMEHLDGIRFLDWPSSNNPPAIKAGLHALTLLALETGGQLLELLDEHELALQCQKTSVLMKKNKLDCNNSKQAASMMVLAGLEDAEKANSEIIAVGGAKGFSTFYGYYMLEAMAKAGDYVGAMKIISDYWGGMLDLGATSFWEDFNIEWLKDASRIDELPKKNEIDVHATYGDHCYVGFRHSLCHGWASGPTAWLSRHVLGIEPIKPGCEEVRINPHLGDLEWAEGTFPTPKGIIYVKHTKKENGSIKTEVKSPRGVKIIRN